MKLVEDLPAKDRPGRLAWLGPLSFGLALLSWFFPIWGIALAVVALTCGIASLRTRGRYAADWTAVSGIVVAVLQAVFSLLLLGVELHTAG
ncbi:hypothetical protein JOF53_000976 [Crossiella equi]|uniref:DUF4190 domain-containing protein n=1 Tax=Crossiella equi TaxID=130796 RepID=A0ABS5A7A2_9PSEU|nr:hypothetical protein [Crossiella equi]MBP2472104.1 hypothetical protein [Crossiella equi]